MPDDIPHLNLRIRGGIEYDPTTDDWRPVIHIWKNREGLTDPDESYRWGQTYATQPQALAAYHAHVRPALQAMITKANRLAVSVDIHRWGFIPEE